MPARSVGPMETTRLFSGKRAPPTVLANGMEKDLLTDNNDKEKSWFLEYVRPCVAELFGTTVFVFVSSMAVVTGTSTVIALAHGFTIAVLVASFGAISGGHVNPAVTLGAVLCGWIGPLTAGLYVLCQLTGSVLGASFCMGCLSYVPPEAPRNQTQFELISKMIYDLPSDASEPMALLAEIVLTTLLVTTVLLTQMDTEGKNQVHPIGIGFAVLIGTLAGLEVSGGAMNPALRFGPAVIMSARENVWDHQWIYWVGPLGGAIISAFLYRLVFGKSEKRWIW